MHRHYNLLTFYLWNKCVFFPRRKDSAKLAARKRFLLPSPSLRFHLEWKRWTPPSDPNFIASWFPLRFFPTIHQSPAKMLFFSSSIRNQHRSKFSNRFPPSLQFFSSIFACLIIYLSRRKISIQYFFLLRSEVFQKKYNARSNAFIDFYIILSFYIDLYTKWYIQEFLNYYWRDRENY